jgi:hypothetical protein
MAWLQLQCSTAVVAVVHADRVRMIAVGASSELHDFQWQEAMRPSGRPRASSPMLMRKAVRDHSLILERSPRIASGARHQVAFPDRRAGRAVHSAVSGYRQGMRLWNCVRELANSCKMLSSSDPVGVIDRRPNILRGSNRGRIVRRKFG